MTRPPRGSRQARWDGSVSFPREDETAVIPRTWAPSDIERGAHGPEVPSAGMAGVRPSASRPSGRYPRWTSAVSSLGRAPEVLALSALGVVVVAAGYAGSRSGSGWATAAYWVGNLLVFCPVVARMLSRRLAGTTEALALVLGLAINQYLLKWAYSPLQLKFPDELQHQLGTETVVRTGILFRPNPALPVSAHFPGLEEMGAAVATMTGVSLTTAAFVVAGVAHVAFVGMFFAVVRRASGSAALAGTACLIYSTALHYLFFDSMYVYQTGALPFLMLAVWAAVARQQQSGGRSLTYPLLGAVAVAAVTVTHHVTAVVTVGVLMVMALCDLLFARPRRFRVLPLALVAVLIVGAWFSLVASDVVTYFSPSAKGLIAGVSRLMGGSAASNGGSSGGPIWETALQALGLLALLVVAVIGVRINLRSEGHRAWRWAVLLGSAAYFAATSLRFLGAQGPELAGRASTFTYLPIAVLTAAVLLQRPHAEATSRHRARTRFPASWQLSAGLALAALLMVSARLGGWPPRYERLPGDGYLVAAFERSVDAKSVTAAGWSRAWLGGGHRFAADISGAGLVSTYGAQVPVRGSAQLYYDPQWGLRDQNLQKQLAIDFVWIDMRLSQQLPASGSYFAPDPQANRQTGPIPAESLAKFAKIVGASRVYDNGTIEIYDMRNT